MKKIIFALTLILLVLSFSACDSDVNLPEMTEDEYPRILGRWPEKDANGNLGVFDAQVGKEFEMELMFTPSNLSEGIWYLDGVEYSRGNVFQYYSGAPVTHHLKLVVTTPKYSTSREGMLVVKAAK